MDLLVSLPAKTNFLCLAVLIIIQEMSSVVQQNSLQVYVPNRNLDCISNGSVTSMQQLQL